MSKITLLFSPLKKLINGIAKVTFNSETAIKELSYDSLEDLNNKYLYIGVTVIESTGEFFFFFLTFSWEIFRKYIKSINDFYRSFTFYFLS